MKSMTLSKNGSSAIGLELFFEDKKKIAAIINEGIQLIGNSTVREAAAHLLSAGGKMLRSSVVTTCYKAVGGRDVQRILPVAAAVELVHNWSLVHDDIIDNSSTRRGVETIHEKWDASTALLTGDALNNLVYLLIARSGFRAEQLEKMIEAVANVSLQLIDGQLMDTGFQRADGITEQDYFQMADRKTGALIKCAAKTGAMLGSDNPSCVAAIETYGEKIGIAFQIKDDLIDMTGDEEDTGKDFGGDIKEGKKTLVLLHALRNASPLHSRRLAEIISNQSVSLCAIHEAIDIMREAGSFEYAGQILNKLIGEAKQQLALLPPSDYITALTELADFIGKPHRIKVEFPLYTI
ncbi:MAG TPA: polyprenyl synthetase family protein [Chitinophagales bacterium]|nr:polyprenyl synthetase family protein [Chitinophagales bacterium]